MADALGTTSACAENTEGGYPVQGTPGNYLRVRGEYTTSGSAPFESMELPPRARRIHIRVVVTRNVQGTTSACAENTSRIVTTGSMRWNYLRVRGEYPTRGDSDFLDVELPPRARRILWATPFTPPSGGTTSACAENTLIAL